tara:strand:+ start:226 stop:504 length:279 start_codon:yes stop_codon:yes gene_type:complete
VHLLPEVLIGELSAALTTALSGLVTAIEAAGGTDLVHAGPPREQYAAGGDPLPLREGPETFEKVLRKILKGLRTRVDRKATTKEVCRERSFV